MNERKLRIVHVCLASSYTEGMTYQDNMLPAQNRKDGHEVLIVSDCTCYKDGKLTMVNPENQLLDDGSRLVRLPFSGAVLPQFLRNRLRIAPQLAGLLDNFRPDVILYHGVIGAEMLTVGAYKRKNPGTRLYLDSHEDFNNSGRSPASRILQYKLLTRFFWNRIEHLVDKVFYVSHESRHFLREMFAISEQQMEFFPLGGYVQDMNAKAQVRHRIRSELGLSEKHVVFIHSGKLNHNKRSIETLQAFISTPEPLYRLLIVGTLESDVKERANTLIASDRRISFLGWQTGAKLVELLCASDCYVQPGSQSATLQVAMCCGLPVLIYPHPSHAPYLKGNGYFVESTKEISERLKELNDPKARLHMSCASFDIAQELLDYRMLARRLYY